MLMYSLTIVTVCFNAREDLRGTTDSVVAYKQRHDLSVEHLIVDGSSADGTPELLREWLAEGKIEAYVSEPDEGIYDAMNKGIRLARGKVLMFLNAGDLLTGEGLRECVEPIVQGRYATAGAPVVHSSDPAKKPDFPVFEYIYLGAPVCHQGYFAATDLYRRLGGYDAATYRCMADADFICRAYAATGEPYVSRVPVAIFADGGFSQNCGYRFLPEYLEIRERHWDAIQKHCAEDAHYAELITFALLEHCTYLVRWVPEFGLEKSKIELQREHVRDQRRTTHSWKQKLLLLWAERVCLQQLCSMGKNTPLVAKLAYWAAIAGSLRPDNPFMKMEHYPHRSLRRALIALLKSRFLRLVGKRKTGAG